MGDRPPSGDERTLLDRAAAGDDGAWRELIGHYHGRLRRTVALRLDHRLTGRVDPSDVLQEVYLEGTRRLPEYLQTPTLSFFLWLRYLAGDRLVRLHRFHLGTQARDASREVTVSLGPAPEASAAALAAHLLAPGPTPCEAAVRAEQLAFLEDAMGRLEPLDREVIALRHFEQLTSAEAAQVLGVSPAAAAKRYFRAVRRLKDRLAHMPGGLDGFRP